MAESTPAPPTADWPTRPHGQSSRGFSCVCPERKGQTAQMKCGVLPHLDLASQSSTGLVAVTTSAFIHFYYTWLNAKLAPFRRLHAIYVLLLPHQRLKHKYNPSTAVSFFGEGKHSSALKEEPRIRVYFDPLIRMCPWRMQELRYTGSTGYTDPIWRDEQPGDSGPTAVTSRFEFIGR